MNKHLLTRVVLLSLLVVNKTFCPNLMRLASGMSAPKPTITIPTINIKNDTTNKQNLSVFFGMTDGVGPYYVSIPAGATKVLAPSAPKNISLDLTQISLSESSEVIYNTKTSNDGKPLKDIIIKTVNGKTVIVENK